MKVKKVGSSTQKTIIKFRNQKDAAGIVDFKGKKNEVSVRYEDETCILYCGIGESAETIAGIVRKSAAAGARKAGQLEKRSIAVEFDTKDTRRPDTQAAALEGLLLGSYVFDTYKSEKPAVVSVIELVDTVLRPKDIKHIRAVYDGVCFARDLVNENAESVNPQRLAKEARSIATKGGMKCEVLTEKNIVEKKLGLLNAVGKGSQTPPRLAIISYKGDPRSKEVTAVVGKGITFDSGGQNLKPSGHIETMREDMGGAAAVLGLMKTVAQLKPKVNLLGVIPAAHNAVGSKSCFPGDVHTSYSGKTVEIINTDAEGRLILADAMSYCQKHYSPTRIVDLATLTGGIVYALGTTVAGVFSSSDTLAEKLYKSGQRTNERVWRFPIYEEHSDAMKSEFADLRNISKLKRGEAGSITAAAFLKEFVNEKVEWAHIDIAGVAFREGEPHAEMPRMGTGFGVRLLSDLLFPSYK